MLHQVNLFDVGKRGKTDSNSKNRKGKFHQRWTRNTNETKQWDFKEIRRKGKKNAEVDEDTFKMKKSKKDSTTETDMKKLVNIYARNVKFHFQPVEF